MSEFIEWVKAAGTVITGVILGSLAIAAVFLTVIIGAWLFMPWDQATVVGPGIVLMLLIVVAIIQEKRGRGIFDD